MLLDLSTLSVLTVIGFVLMNFVLQVEAQECEIGGPDFPFCHSTNDNQQEEDQCEEETPTQNSLDATQEERPSTASANSVSSTSSAGCVSNTVEPEEPEIRKDGNTITGTICDDEIRGSDGRDIITALAGNDDVEGREGDDVIYGMMAMISC